MTLSLNILEILTEEKVAYFRDYGCLYFYICRDTHTHITPPEIIYFVIIGILYRPRQRKHLVQ